MGPEITFKKVGNGTPNYPGDFTKKEKSLIRSHSKGKILNLFSGISTLGNIRVDYSSKMANINMDVFQFLELFNQKFNTVIIDPPYNQRFADKYQKIGNTPKQFIIFASVKQTKRLFSLIEKQINPDILIIKSWNYYLPLGYSEENSQAYLCYAGGYRKSTILMICKRK